MRGWVIIAVMAACSSRKDPAPEAKVVAHAPAPAPTFELTPLERKLMRIDLALARIDPSFHSLRIEWPGEAVDQWQWPDWVTQKSEVEILDELLSAADTAPARPELDRAVGDYARQMTTDVQLLEQLVLRFGSVVEAHPSANRPTNDDVMPILNRFAAASQRVHAALRAVRPADRFVHGSRFALYRVCTHALATMADLPPQTSVPDQVVGSYRTVADEVSRRSRACLRAAIDYVDRRAASVATREDSLYVADLATSIGLRLLNDSDELAEGRENYSSSHNISQVAAYFAQQFRKDVPAPSP